MTRRILINGRRAEEVRVAIVDNQTLDDFEIETKHSGLLRNNIYRGVVSNIAPSLNAAFVDFGDQKNGFLAFNDVVESVYAKPCKDACRIADVLVPGQQLIVQVIKDATALKGAQVTTNISLAGRYLVLRPKDAKSGVSRKIDEDSRADLTQKVRSLDLPEGYGCIVRTNAMDQSRAVLLRDAKALVQLWLKIEAENAKGNDPKLLYNDQDIVVSVMRDYFDSSINEVLIDDRSCFERARTYVKATFAGGEEKVKLYDDKLPIFSRFGLEKQIEQIYARTVSLPSGGFIVIDPTEALTAIDVNSAHATKRESQDLTAYHTNMEAAAEIGRQLRMRDIGGLIVVDFIDMRLGKHQRDVERAMRNALARDKARTKVERISANGLLEINRQRISQALSQRNHRECPTCGGRGFIPSAEAIGLTLIREIDARAANGNLGGVIIKLHPDIAQQLQNERRREFAQIENEYDIRIEIVATREMSRGDESIEWLTKKQEDALHPQKNNASDEATSIIDVAQVYENQDELNDAYRPNDFEEYSSDEARKRRANKRANRALHEQPIPAPASDATSPKTTDVPNSACAAINLAILAAMLDVMQNAMNDDSHDHARSRRFSPRRRNIRRHHESDNLASDIRMFSLDILKAVCTMGLGYAEDISRKEMLNAMPEAIQWLSDKAEDTQRAAQSANLIRNAITSRHALARLDILFGETGKQDDIASILLNVRTKFDNFKPDTNTIQNIKTLLLEHLTPILNKNATVESHATEKTSDSETVGSDVIENDAPVAPSAPILENISEPTVQDDISNTMEETPRRRSRRVRRAAIGTPENAPQALNETHPVLESDHTGGDVVTADVVIPPMTIVNDNDDALEITQEMPAISRRGRARRERRANIVNDSAKTETAKLSVSTPIPAGDANPKSDTPSEALSSLTQPAGVSKNPETLQMPKQLGERTIRRVRKTRNIPLDLACYERSNQPDFSTISESGIADNTLKTEPENRPTSESNDSIATSTTPEMTASSNANQTSVAAQESPKRERPARRTRRSIQNEQAKTSDTAVAILSNPPQAQQQTEENTPEMTSSQIPTPNTQPEPPSSKPERRIRKTRKPALDEFSAPNVTSASTPIATADPTTEEKPDKTATNSERRVRKTRKTTARMTQTDAGMGSETTTQSNNTDIPAQSTAASTPQSPRRARKPRQTNNDVAVTDSPSEKTANREESQILPSQISSDDNPHSAKRRVRRERHPRPNMDLT